MVLNATSPMNIAQTIKAIATKEEKKYTTEELIEAYAFESSRINEKDKEIAQKAIRKELKRRFYATLRLLDDEQTIQNPTGTYRYLLNVTD